MRRLIKLLVDVGTVSSNGTALQVTGAHDVCIIYSAETAFHHANATYQDLDSVVTGRLNKAVATGYNALRTEAIEDYQQYYNRTSINLGTSGDIGTHPVPERHDNWQKGGNIANDVEFMALMFNYGKYLLIQSSRPGTLPVNLQGVWNRDYTPPWDSKLTLNVNLEMNYWFAQPLDLREIAVPVVDFLDRLSVTGREVARGMYGAEGWVRCLTDSLSCKRLTTSQCCHHNTDITGYCTPYHGLTIAAPYPLGGAWVAFEAIEYFRFTRDGEFA